MNPISELLTPAELDGVRQIIRSVALTGEAATRMYLHDSSQSMAREYELLTELTVTFSSLLETSRSLTLKD